MSIEATNVGKRDLWYYVNKKINRVVSKFHVFAVLNILFNEMIEDLKNGKSIEIHNFATLSLKKTKPRRYFHFKLRQMMTSEGRHLLQFKMLRRIRVFLYKYIDTEELIKELDKRENK